VIVEALDSAGGLQLARNLFDKLTEWPPLAANLTTAFGFAVASNLINNLPVGLIGASGLHASVASGHLANAMLMGIDLGPNLSVTGSLATSITRENRSDQLRTCAKYRRKNSANTARRSGVLRC
jgi:arsenical pump membrane protein